MTTPPDPTTPLSAQLVLLEQQATRVKHHEAVIADLDEEIEALQQQRAEATQALTVSLSARDRLASIGAIIAPLLNLHAAPTAPAEPSTPAPDPAAEQVPADTQVRVSNAQPSVTEQPQPVPQDQEQQDGPTTPAAPAEEPQGQADAPAPGLEALRSAELNNRLKVLLYVADHPGVTATAVVEGTGLLKASVSATLSVYASQGLIAREGTPFEHSVTAAGIKLLLEYAADSTDAQDDTSDGEPSETDVEPPAPTASAPAPAAPNRPARPDPNSAEGLALAFLEANGPSTLGPVAAHLNMRNGPAGATLHRLHTKGLIERVSDNPPFVYRLHGDFRPQVQAPAPVIRDIVKEPAGAPQEYRSGEISQAELMAQRLKNCAVVKGALSERGKSMTENELLKATGLALSHLRTAVQMLADDNVIVREDGSGFGVRATYRLEDITAELPRPQVEHLTDQGRKVEKVLLEVTDRGGKESVSNLAAAAYVSRDDVLEALGVLHHCQGRLRWARVGSLLLFQVSPKADGAAA